MERDKVVSSMMESIGYDEETKTLEIEFTNGSIWQYEPMTAEGYRDFLKSDSMGSYFHKFIKSNDLLNASCID